MDIELTKDDIRERWDEFLNSIIERWDVESERKQARSQRREQEIKKAALRVFARDGISRTRIGDIAEEADIPTSTIYEYYASKEELAYAVPLQHMCLFFTEYGNAVEGVESAQEKLSLYLWLAADFARRNPVWARLLYLEIWPSVLVENSTLRYCLDDYIHIILYLIEEGELEDEWPVDDDHYETAAILTGSLNQIMITRSLYGRPKNLSKAAASILQRTMAILRPYELKPIRTTR